MQHLEHSQVLNHNNQVVRTTVETKTNHLTTVVVHRQMIKVQVIPKMIPQIKALVNQRRAEMAEEETMVWAVASEQSLDDHRRGLSPSLVQYRSIGIGHRCITFAGPLRQVARARCMKGRLANSGERRRHRSDRDRREAPSQRLMLEGRILRALEHMRCARCATHEHRASHGT